MSLLIKYLKIILQEIGSNSSQKAKKKYLLMSITCYLLILPALSSYCQQIDPDNLLIINVKIPDTSVDGLDQTLNLLVKEGTLNQISPEQLSVSEDVAVLDARGGIILGDLKLGNKPSFIIIKEDPRKNFKVWLYMEDYIIFALDKGVVHRNRLWRGDVQNTSNRQTETKIFTYTPPPFSLPVEFGEDRWNHWDNKSFSGVFTSVLALDRQFWLSQNDASIDQVGELNAVAGGVIRGFRFGVIGQLKFFKRPWIYTVFAATRAYDKGFDSGEDNSIVWFDYRLDIPINETLLLSIGKQKEPISLERLSPSHLAPQQERTAASDAFIRARNTGAQLSGNFLNGYGTWAGGIFNPWLDNPGGIGDNPTSLVGRVTGLPFTSSDDHQLIHLGVSALYSNGSDRVRFRNSPEFFNSPDFIDTESFKANNITLLNFELSYRNGPFWVASEFTPTFMNSMGEKLKFTGFYLQAAYVLTGEKRGYRKKTGTFDAVPVARSVMQGGIGAIEVSSRFSKSNFNDGSVVGGNMNIWSLGANWWLTPSFGISCNFRWIGVDRLQGNIERTTGLNARILLILQ